MTAIMCVGIATLDRVYQVAEHPTTPRKYRATARTVVGGGVAANAAVTAARLGGRVRFIGALGDDPTGDTILAGLAEEGIDVTGVARVGGALSPESAVLVDATGERLIVNHASPDLFDRAPAPAPDLAGSSAVLVDMRWRAAAIGALEAAAAAGIPGVVDCDHDPADSPGILEAASHVVFALGTLCAWVGQTDPARAVEAGATRLGAWVGATAGERGTWWSDGGPASHHPAIAVEAVDTLGAGDVFHGAFALALAEGRAMGEVLERASAAAALKCTRFGGRAGIPTPEELAAFLAGRTS